ncbi:hypothetical protein AAC387_Pa08g2118 [Persea americana]
MGITEGFEDGAVVDCSVGTIVWVRRRNGSWWPGRILGPNELSASHLMSPRSGTPVKLLGREDASVDWYNLEKSKRVKAFRCGEFNDCIERAESSQGIPIRKREKYARREDAILHALELEKEHLEKNQHRLGAASTSICIGNNSFSPAENHPRGNAARDHRKFVNVKSEMLSKRRDSPHDRVSVGNPSHTQNVRYSKQARWEDDNSEAIPRMRGLQDFGLKIAQSKGRFSTPVTCESSQQPVSVDHLHVTPFGVHNTGISGHTSNTNNSLMLKRKRSQSSMIEESLVKRRDRRRPLVQVLQSSAKLPVYESLRSNDDPASISNHKDKEHMGISYRAKRSRCVYLPPESSNCLDRTEFSSEQMHISPSNFEMDNLHPGSQSEENTSSGLIEAQESDSSEETGTEPGMEEEAAGFSDPTNSGRYTGNVIEELEDPLPSHPHEQTAWVTADMGRSKWQLKGKRNSRNLSKRTMETMDGKDSAVRGYKCNGSIDGSCYEDNVITPRSVRTESEWAVGRGSYHKSGELNYAYEGDLIENESVQTQTMGFISRRYPLAFTPSSRDQERRNHSINGLYEDSHVIPSSIWEGNGLSQGTRRGGYWEDPDECFDPRYTHRRSNNGMESMLVDVDLKVQASYQGERVPLVSLMSRLNGKAIIGHPIQIEPTEDGYSDSLLATNNFGQEPLDVDGNTGLSPVWRTARRTAMYRVPRPHPSSALGEEVDPLSNSDIDIKPPVRKSHTNHSNHNMRLMKKSFSHARRPLPEKKFPKKLLKKISLSNQKTRTLSSIAIEQRLSGEIGEHKFGDRNGDVDGSIKPEEEVPSVTCVPVKLVFSRILEAVGRPSSKATTHEV